MKNKAVQKKKNLVLPMLFLTVVIIQSQPIHAFSLNNEDMVIDKNLNTNDIITTEIHNMYSFDNTVTVVLNKLLPLQDLFDEQVKIFHKDISKIDSIKIISTGDYKLKSDDFDFLNNFGFKHIDISQAKCNNDEIPNDAFSDNRFLHTIKFPYSIVRIGDYAFENCVNLKGKLIIPDNIKVIGRSSFAGCGFNGFSLPKSFDNIPEFFATRWMNLKVVNIEDNIKIINEGAFLGSPIESLTINHQVEFKENCI